MAMGTYRVTGEHAVFGHQPGETFQRDIPAEQEARLIERGAISKSQTKNPDAVDRQPSGGQE